VFVTVTNEIADNQEVTDESGFLDDREFKFQPVHHGLDGGGDIWFQVQIPLPGFATLSPPGGARAGRGFVV